MAGDTKVRVIGQELAICIPTAKADSLARALREGLTKPDLLKEFGRAGREWVLENFTTEKMCAETMRVYQDLILPEKRKTV